MLTIVRSPIVEFINKVFRLTVLFIMVFFVPSTSWAQCQMCGKTASYQRASAIQALNRGIILLAVPPAVIIGGIVWLTYRHRNGYRIRD